MTVIQVEPGGEIFISFAKKKLRRWHAEMLRSGVQILHRVIEISEGSRIYIDSVLLGNGVFRDRIRITGAGARLYGINGGGASAVLKFGTYRGAVETITRSYAAVDGTFADHATWSRTGKVLAYLRDVNPTSGAATAVIVRFGAASGGGDLITEVADVTAFVSSTALNWSSPIAATSGTLNSVPISMNSSGDTILLGADSSGDDLTAAFVRLVWNSETGVYGETRFSLPAASFEALAVGTPSVYNPQRTDTIGGEVSFFYAPLASLASPPTLRWYADRPASGSTVSLRFNPGRPDRGHAIVQIPVISGVSTTSTASSRVHDFEITWHVVGLALDALTGDWTQTYHEEVDAVIVSALDYRDGASFIVSPGVDGAGESRAVLSRETFAQLSSLGGGESSFQVAALLPGVASDHELVPADHVFQQVRYGGVTPRGDTSVILQTDPEILYDFKRGAVRALADTGAFYVDGAEVLGEISVAPGDTYTVLHYGAGSRILVQNASNPSAGAYWVHGGTVTLLGVTSGAVRASKSGRYVIGRIGDELGTFLDGAEIFRESIDPFSSTPGELAVFYGPSYQIEGEFLGQHLAPDSAPVNALMQVVQDDEGVWSRRVNSVFPDTTFNPRTPEALLAQL